MAVTKHTPEYRRLAGVGTRVSCSCGFRVVESGEGQAAAAWRAHERMEALTAQGCPFGEPECTDASHARLAGRL